jgi:hypothetical protein
MRDSESSFVVSVLLRGEHCPPLPPDERLWQETVLSVRAADEEAARSRALEIARQSECEYESVTGDTVRWVVESVAGAWRFEGELPDGAELFSRFLRATEGESLLKPFEG